MKLKLGVAALAVCMLAIVAVADAHKLPLGAAKNAIKQETASVCRELEDCKNWSVGPCQRKSLHRVDCVSRVSNGEGGSCAWVTIARVPARSYEIHVHHKRIFC